MTLAQHDGVAQHQQRPEDGSLVIKARLPAEAGALFLKAPEAAANELPPPDVANVSAATSLEPVQPRTARRADALAWMAEGFLASEQNTLTGGDRQQNEHGEPLNVGRKTRTIPPALRRALNSRDRGCRFPGCTHSRFVDGHHVQHWAQGGETKLANLVSLCRFHHRLVHEGMIVMQVLDDGAFRFIRPDGRSFDSDSPRELKQLDWMQWVAAHQARRFDITPRTAITGWQGETLDYGLAVDGLLQRAHHAKNVAAETSRA